ncbi:sulfite exporter TauE/SafE family protein [Caminicella sporogenes]|uniref:sulfite exporter TauE/SafE family protein n=1 Tax=Caminicella sporogenes TaxID=166485 RepID=UPI00253FCEAD|nr:sulfite exporter TauE/SafE family protein [Caminicella sporogenes]WIF94017.1 sulfite exporter TauE/SafE family protein [Caminicella sporogenes]
MNVITTVLSALAAFGAWFAAVFVKDFMKHKDNLEDNSWVKVTSIGFVTNFFDTLGIGSFAPTTALLRAFKQVHDRVIPGTLNVSCTLPVIVEAFIFIKVIQVEIVTLISMIAAATIGAWIGAGIVSKLPEKKVQITMGIALFITAFLMFAGQMKWMPGGGEAIGLTGGKLIIGIIVNFILGALMTAGIGLYAPCMALVYMLGMSPKVAFPIMMGSCAFLMPVASVKFVKEGAYDRRASMGITLGGIVGVIIAAYIVKSLPLNALRWIVIGVILYTSVTLIKSATNTKNSEIFDEN